MDADTDARSLSAVRYLPRFFLGLAVLFAGATDFGVALGARRLSELAARRAARWWLVGVGVVLCHPITIRDLLGQQRRAPQPPPPPVAAEQVAAVANSIGERYPVYELMTYFAAYTGLRAEELAGLEVGDLVFAPGPSCTVHVRRAKKSGAGEWTPDTLKSAKSRRTVPLPGWLATRLVDHLADTHPRSTEPHAPLWPNRALGGARRRGCRAVAPLDFTERCDVGAYYKNLLKPALEAVGLLASRPATADAPAVEGVRLHDLRHTFATLQLSAGVHFMQVSQWLGHATYSLTLGVYGGYIPQADGGVPNALPEPPTPAKFGQAASNVVSLFGQQAN